MKTHLLQTLFIALFFAFQLCSNAQAIQGPYPPTFVTEQFAGCLSCPGASWINPMNADDPDSLYATVMLNPHSQCTFGMCFARGLIATGFNFNIPLTALIKGIKAEVLRKASTLNSIVDTNVQLWNGGTMPGGINQALPGFWNTSAAYIVYGDSANTWGLTLSANDINSSGFGVFFQPLNLNPNFTSASVDHVRATVYYQSVSGVEEQTSQGSLFYNYSISDQIISVNTFNQEIINSVRLYNARGQSIFNADFNRELKINTQSFNEGIYLLIVNAGENYFSRKIFLRK